MNLDHQNSRYTESIIQSCTEHLVVSYLRSQVGTSPLQVSSGRHTRLESPTRLNPLSQKYLALPPTREDMSTTSPLRGEDKPGQLLSASVYGGEGRINKQMGVHALFRARRGENMVNFVDTYFQWKGITWFPSSNHRGSSHL